MSSSTRGEAKRSSVGGGSKKPSSKPGSGKGRKKAGSSRGSKTGSGKGRKKAGSSRGSKTGSGKGRKKTGSSKGSKTGSSRGSSRGSRASVPFAAAGYRANLNRLGEDYANIIESSLVKYPNASLNAFWDQYFGKYSGRDADGFQMGSETVSRSPLEHISRFLTLTRKRRGTAIPSEVDMRLVSTAIASAEAAFGYTRGKKIPVGAQANILANAADILAESTRASRKSSKKGSKRASGKGSRRASGKGSRRTSAGKKSTGKRSSGKGSKRASGKGSKRASRTPIDIAAYLSSLDTSDAKIIQSALAKYPNPSAEAFWDQYLGRYSGSQNHAFSIGREKAQRSPLGQISHFLALVRKRRGEAGVTLRDFELVSGAIASAEKALGFSAKAKITASAQPEILSEAAGLLTRKSKGSLIPRKARRNLKAERAAVRGGANWKVILAETKRHLANHAAFSALSGADQHNISFYLALAAFEHQRYTGSEEGNAKTIDRIVKRWLAKGATRASAHAEYTEEKRIAKNKSATRIAGRGTSYLGNKRPQIAALRARFGPKKKALLQFVPKSGDSARDAKNARITSTAIKQLILPRWVRKFSAGRGVSEIEELTNDFIADIKGFIKTVPDIHKRKSPAEQMSSALTHMASLLGKVIDKPDAKSPATIRRTHKNWLWQQYINRFPDIGVLRIWEIVQIHQKYARHNGIGDKDASLLIKTIVREWNAAGKAIDGWRTTEARTASPSSLALLESQLSQAMTMARVR